MGLKQSKLTKAPNPWPITLALVMTLLIIEGLVAVVWSSTRPETISVEDYNDLQAELTTQIQAKDTALATALSQAKTAESKTKRLEQDVTQLRQKVTRLIDPEQLPLQVKGITASQTLNKIQDLCDKTSSSVNPENVNALLSILIEIQKNSVINTALDAKDTARQTLYKQIQIVLNQIDAYAGPIRSDKTSTLSAVKAYQQANNLKVDGKIGINTFMDMVKTFQEKRLSN